MQTSINFRVPEEVKKALFQHFNSQGLSSSKVLRLLVESYLKSRNIAVETPK